MTLLVSLPFAARADFSYTTTRKTTGGTMAAMAGTAGNSVSKIQIKGQKMKTETGDTATIIDFDLMTITSLNNAQKTFDVRVYGTAFTNPADSGLTITAKETGQSRTINGFPCNELALTMEMDLSKAGRGMGGKIQMEVDLWISSAVPGTADLLSFYRKNMSKFPWSVMVGGDSAGANGIQSALAEVLKKLATLDGVAVEQVIRVKQPTGTTMQAMPQITDAQAAQVQAAVARLEAMKAQGGPGAALAEQQLARIRAMTGVATAAASGSPGPLLEMTVDSGAFTSDGIPDSAFAIPASYKNSNPPFFAMPE